MACVVKVSPRLIFRVKVPGQPVLAVYDHTRVPLMWVGDCSAESPQSLTLTDCKDCETTAAIADTDPDGPVALALERSLPGSFAANRVPSRTAPDSLYLIPNAFPKS